MADLRVVLDAASVAAVRALGRYPVLRGDHVTLAHGADPGEFSRHWVPGGATTGEAVTLCVVGQCADDRVHALLVEIDGQRRRPYDGGVLHVTVCRQPWARSSEANALCEIAAPSPLRLELRGVVGWR